MRFHNMPSAKVRPNDRPAMIQAIQALYGQGIDVRRPDGTQHQLKVSSKLSFYPTTGRIVPDGCQALASRGLAALVEALQPNRTT